MPRPSDCLQAAALAVCFVAGCRSKAVHDVRGRDAVITPDVAVVWSYGPGMELVEVNGRAVNSQKASRFVIPSGKTYVYAASTRFIGVGGGNEHGGAGAAFGPGTMRIDFTTLAGHEYRIGYPALWIGRQAYVEDLTIKQKLQDILIRGEPAKTE
jgi:hypothetical protein